MAGFEPATPSLRTRCSPTEPHPHDLLISYFIIALRSRVLMNAPSSSLTSGCCRPRKRLAVMRPALLPASKRCPLVLQAEDGHCREEAP